MRYADIYLKLLLPGASQEMRATGSDNRLDFNLAVGAYRAVEVVYTSVDRIVQAFRDRKARRQTLESLSRLDERLLRDIGLRRDQIPAFIEQLSREHSGDSGADPRPGFGSSSSSVSTSLNA